jgi:hypothetical protein
VYGDGLKDIYGIRKVAKEILTSTGIKLYLDENEIPVEVMKHPCSMLHGLAGNKASPSGQGYSTVRIVFTDCNNDTVLKFFAEAKLEHSPAETKNNFMNAARQALTSLNGFQHHYSNTQNESANEVPVETVDSIPWSENRKLNWSDFKGVAIESDPGDALTFTSNETKFDMYGVGDRLNVNSEIICYFIKQRSWVKKGKEMDKLLTHEQRHFDIAECGARELRKKIKLAHFTAVNFNEQINRMTKEVNDKYGKMQQQYDAETNHSRIEEKQNEWNSRVNAMLNELKEYKHQ